MDLSTHTQTQYAVGWLSHLFEAPPPISEALCEVVQLVGHFKEELLFFPSPSLSLKVKTQLKMKLAVFASLLMIIPFQAEANTCVNKKVLVWVTHGKNLGDGLQSPDPYVVVSSQNITKYKMESSGF